MKQAERTILDNLVNSYLHTAIWVEDDDGNGYDFTKKAKAIAKQDCQLFIDRVREEFTADEANAIITYQGQDVTTLAGHDFYLTRNGHGAGFFDKEVYNELATNGCDRLTEIASKFGSATCYEYRKKWHFD